MTFLSLALLGLATWRLSSMLVRERGPLDMFVWIRQRAGIQHDPEKKPFIYPDTFFSELLSCVWCVSVWVGTFWFLFFLVAPLLAEKIATVFAISTVAIMIDHWMGN